ncbi:heavy metal translocating P-type ATPase [Silvimonas iriomotensis]|uniref:Copper-translocating P-type ATPase n=1 Tax=Silvimonas iriomotensis TaxID=449662 RepID=A0ABQ2P6D6_9NEIS|nr:heavy metal translocating P-type ATPase [Silvimonas iriomotensis]GGP19118.1 copper-translocating P-type ATPase [Silvimonas iriomotensis]
MNDIASAPCFHCGEPVPRNLNYTVVYRDIPRPVCCAGCQSVASSIIDAGLADYYEQREQPADRAQPLPAELQERLRLYDDPALQQGFVTGDGSNGREAALLIEGISCAACIWLNERQIARVPGVREVSINYTTHRARVRWDNSKTQLSDILKAVADIGYHAQPYDRARQELVADKTRKSALFRLWVAGLSMMQVMMFTVPIYINGIEDIAPQWLRLLQWAGFMLTLPVVLYSAWPFYVSSWRDARRGRAGMDLPVSIGVLAAFAASTWTLIAGHGEVYFDSVSMFVFLLLGGRYLESRARRRAGAALDDLAGMLPAFAHRQTAPDYAQIEEVAVIHLRPDDRVLVKPGEIIPVDGVVLQGQSSVNEALLTGESAPVSKAERHDVTAGTVNLDSPLIIKTTHVGESTRLAGIVRLLDGALAEKPRIAQVADKISGLFVAVLLGVALLTWLFWQWHDPQHALPIAIAVLVISCPCALSLATPAALTAATGHLALRGLLVSRGHTLETMTDVTDIVFDKTGTLTQGQPRLIHTAVWYGEPERAAGIAAALEAHSEHPLAHALSRETAVFATDVTNHPGGGLTGMIDGTGYTIGKLQFVAAHCAAAPPGVPADAPAGTHIWLACATKWIACFTLADSVRPEAAGAVQALQKQGYTVHLLSGDHEAAVADLAATLGIASHTASATPAGKLKVMQQLQRSGKKVMMIGDGVNDAPVLALAHVSVAMGSGVDIAQATGDAVLYDSKLDVLPMALALARKTRKVIRQNLAWALGYNLVALPLAVCGLVTPWLASLGMAASSLLVVGNALRLAAPGRLKHNKKTTADQGLA